ncbi:MAG: hypothetical protein JZD41_06085 [Thermoproteus sp.]|nr:hypothetical protein [Thermoproteus sp.]
MNPNPKLVEELTHIANQLYDDGYIEAARLLEEARRIILEMEREALLPPATD